MLELALDAILDFAGERKAAFRMIFCEVQSHAAYGTSPELFNVFFEVIADMRARADRQRVDRRRRGGLARLARRA